jgi:hypothetical protein
VLDCWAPAISTRSQLGSLGIRLIRALYIGKEMKSIEERGTASTPTLITSFHVSAKRERNRRRRGGGGGWAWASNFPLMDVCRTYRRRRESRLQGGALKSNLQHRRVRK